MTRKKLSIIFIMIITFGIVSIPLISCEPNQTSQTHYNTNLTQSASGSTSNGELPNKFDIDEYVVSIGTDFKLSNGDYIDQEIISLTSNFTLTHNGSQIARSKQRLISIGSKIDIYDENDDKIGMVEEQIFSSWGVYSKYYIYGANGNKIAKSEKHDLMATSFTIKDMSGSVICKVKRPMINLMSDSWSVDFKTDKYDKRLFVFIPCYKTHRDNQKK